MNTSMVRTDDGVALEYTVLGSGPRNLLFLHGWGNAASFWGDMIGRLDLGDLRCVAPSFRGHGGSDKSESGYTHERFARDMFAVADAVGAEKLVLVGFSMAGKFAAYMAAVEPERVVGQVLIAPAGPAELPVPRALFDPWLAAAPYPEKFKEVLAPFVKIPLRPDLLDLYCRNVALSCRAAQVGTIEMFAYTSIVEKARLVKAPTLVVGGIFDPIVTPDYLRKEFAVIPGARIALLNCGHETPMEMPVETAGMIEAFLAGLR